MCNRLLDRPLGAAMKLSCFHDRAFRRINAAITREQSMREASNLANDIHADCESGALRCYPASEKRDDTSRVSFRFYQAA